jgi:hypothetical protein
MRIYIIDRRWCNKEEFIYLICSGVGGGLEIRIERGR